MEANVGNTKEARLISDPAPTRQAPSRPRLSVGKISRSYGLLIAWGVLIITYTILLPHTFATFADVRVIAGSQVVILILTLGLMVPCAAGEFDLSVAGTANLSLVLVGWLNVVHGWSIGPTILVALAVGVLVGLVNAVLVVFVTVESLIVTLGMGTLLIGIDIAINDQTIGNISPFLVHATQNNVLGLPAAFFYGLGLTLILGYIFTFTPLGRHVYLTGTARTVARLAGIRVNAVVFGSFIASGLISAFAGVIMSGWIDGSDPTILQNYLLAAFASLFLGSTAIRPGYFNPWGSFVAVYFLVTGITGLELLGYSGWIEQVFYGGSLVVAVAAARLASRRSGASQQVSARGHN
jgi:ribose transport system permease protein